METQIIRAAMSALETGQVEGEWHMDTDIDTQACTQPCACTHTYSFIDGWANMHSYA